MGFHRAAQAYTATARHAQHLAATATEKQAIFMAPQKARVVRVDVASDVAVTGDNTNTTNLNLVNAGSDGTGTTEVGNKDLTTGVNVAALDMVNIPLNTTYTNGVDLAEGDVLALQYEKVGTGAAVGPLVVNVEWVPV